MQQPQQQRQQQQPGTWAKRVGTAPPQAAAVQSRGRVRTVQLASAVQSPAKQPINNAKNADGKEREEKQQQTTTTTTAAAAPKPKPAFQPAKAVPGVGAMPQPNIDTALATLAW